MTPVFEIRGVSSSLRKGEDGIWYSPEEADISYPAEGNDRCFTIEEQSFWFKHRNDCIIEVVSSFPPGDKGPIFDIGGGNGFVSLGIANAGFDVVLVEPGRSGATNAKKRGIDNVICATTQTARFNENSLSAVGLFDVLEHIEDDKALLLSMHGLLRSDAPLYLTVPAYNFLWSNEDESAGHFRRYTLNNVSLLLRSTGFKILYASYFFRFLPFPIFLLRTIPSQLGLPKSMPDNRKQERDHAASNGIAARVLHRMLATEVDNMRKKRTMCFGGSCLIVAKK